MPSSACYVCGHSIEEHMKNGSLHECQFEGGCDCICFEEGDDDEE
jgi:hypothetical protein